MVRRMADRISGLYYLTYIDNLPSILEQGILSHNQVDARGVAYRPIFDRGIVQRRAQLKTPDNRPLWDYANLYFQPRNPMLFRVKEEVGVENVVVVKVKASVLNQRGVWLTDGKTRRRRGSCYSLPRRIGRKHRSLNTSSMGCAGCWTTMNRSRFAHWRFLRWGVVWAD